MSNIVNKQSAYKNRPFAVKWVDSHFSGTFRFETLDDALEYVQQQWSKIRSEVQSEHYCASNLSRSKLETPDGTLSLKWWLLTDDVSGY